LAVAGRLFVALFYNKVIMWPSLPAGRLLVISLQNSIDGALSGLNWR